MAGSSDIILLMLTVLRRSVIREVESLPRGRKKKEGGCKGLDSNSECRYRDRKGITEKEGGYVVWRARD